MKVNGEGEGEPQQQRDMKWERTSTTASGRSSSRWRRRKLRRMDEEGAGSMDRTATWSFSRVEIHGEGGGDSRNKGGREIGRGGAEELWRIKSEHNRRSSRSMAMAATPLQRKKKKKEISQEV